MLEIELASADGTAYPEWNSGTEAMVSNSTTIAVAVRPDTEGDVRVEVWRGELPTLPESHRLGQVQLNIAGGRAHIGNTVGGEAYRVQRTAERKERIGRFGQ